MILGPLGENVFSNANPSQSKHLATLFIPERFETGLITMITVPTSGFTQQGHIFFCAKQDVHEIVLCEGIYVYIM